MHQLLAHGRWFSPGTLASSTTNTGRHDIAEIFQKVALNTKNYKKKTINHFSFLLRQKLIGTTTQMVIQKASLISIGAYTCSAINDAGKDQKTVVLLVTGSEFIA